MVRSAGGSIRGWTPGSPAVDTVRVISFVIPAHDEELWIARCMMSIRDAANELGVEFETIVVDDGSTDRTAALARAAGATVLSVAHRKISATRNAGARSARGDVLVFVDADTEISTRALAEALDAVRHGATGGGALIRFDGRVPLWGHLATWMIVPAFRLARYSAGCFMFCTRAAFEASQGYDERLFGGEEIRFAQALKKTGRFQLIRTRVVTSGRKLRSHSLAELLPLLARFALRGERMVRDRAGLDLWYGPRRADPERAAPAPTPHAGSSPR